MTYEQRGEMGPSYNGIRISLSFCSQVYKVEKDGQVLAKKVFVSPLSPLIGFLYRMANGKSPYPYTTEAGIAAAYEKRRMAHRLSRFFSEDVYVVDAIARCEHEPGFYSPFVKGKFPRTKAENLCAQRCLAQLESFFKEIGMPTWSFGRYHSDWTWRLRQKNIIISRGKIRIVDYEEVVPLLSYKGITFVFNGVDLDLVNKFVEDKTETLRDKLGSEESNNLAESMERYEHYVKLLKGY